MFPLPRVVYAMAEDGLIFRWLSDVNPTLQTPLKATVVAGVLAGLMAALFELKSLVDMMSIGTLMAYTIVSASVILLRYQDVPGLDAPSSGEYMALGTLSSEESAVLRGAESDDEASEEEIVYARSVQTDQEANGGLAGNNRRRSSSPITWTSTVRGLFNADRESAPTDSSSRLAASITLAYSVLAAILALLLDNTSSSSGTAFTAALASFLAFLMTICLVLLALQPVTTQSMPFKVPFVPFLPAASIFVNLYLMLKLSAQTWTRFSVWMALGAAVYGCYGWKNSSEEKKKGRT